MIFIYFEVNYDLKETPKQLKNGSKVCSPNTRCRKTAILTGDTLACSRLLESRAKERARGRKGGGLGREKGGKEEEPVIIFLNTSCRQCRALFSKCVNMSKCQNFSLSRILLLARVLEFARLSMRRFDVADTERFSAFGIPSLKNL